MKRKSRSGLVVFVPFHRQSVSCGGGHIGVLTRSGALFLFGQNDSGQCGVPPRPDVPADALKKARVCGLLLIQAHCRRSSRKLRSTNIPSFLHVPMVLQHDWNPTDSAGPQIYREICKVCVSCLFCTGYGQGCCMQPKGQDRPLSSVWHCAVCIF